MKIKRCQKDDLPDFETTEHPSDMSVLRNHTHMITFNLILMVKLVE